MHEDLRYAIRALRQSPGFTITATLTLALGIGANTAIFGLINGFGRPLPVPDADRIVVLAARMAGDDSGLRYRFSLPALEDFRRQGTAFSDVFGFDLRAGALGVNGTTSPFVHQAVTGNFFSGLGLQPAAGRFLRAGEGEHAGAPVTIVLGYGYWQKRFGGDPAVVGSSVRLDGQFATVIGVAPQGFHGLFNGVESDGYPSLSAVAALRAGDTVFGDRTDRGRASRMARAIPPRPVFKSAIARITTRRPIKGRPTTRERGKVPHGTRVERGDDKSPSSNRAPLDVARRPELVEGRRPRPGA